MRPTDKGSIGVAAVISSLLSNGYEVFLPFDGASSVDLIVANEQMDLKRVQVKYRKLLSNNTFLIPLQSVVNGKRVHIDRNKIDGYAIYCPEVKLVYYVSIRDFVGQSSLTLSLNTNNPTARLANKYLDPEVFWH
jgi:hypothetical protein